MVSLRDHKTHGTNRTGTCHIEGRPVFSIPSAHSFFQGDDLAPEADHRTPLKFLGPFAPATSLEQRASVHNLAASAPEIDRLP
jgi:hypothetical protein